MIRKNKTIVITGASSGIGEATAEKFVHEGYNVVLAARRKDKIQAILDRLSQYNGNVKIKVTDVTSQKEVQELIDFTIKEFQQVDILFNNTGLMPLSFMKNRKVDEWEKMIDVNIKGVLYGVNAVLPYMMERNEGHIITTSSVAGHEVAPAETVYAATKFAARVIMEGLGKELAGTNIRTTSISPGFTATDLASTITDQEAIDMLTSGPEVTPLQSKDVAEAVFYAVNQPSRVNVNEVIVRPNDLP
ncbi:SDR family oxidoreductase [Oceanobacillus halophilus]|uniref:SDR family oxidoreductase n=1 Tax=Oceanobacillus halophilus TaxID=930130 RepID=A0A495A2T9_9BACI|nr:SDR family oxidoreductase [Oceanobacillus halophilus]RKQ33897.1 SDR family oxidoreductase [Oceanobacillus halophilus]